MIRSRGKTQQMGHDDPDETDPAGHGDRGTGGGGDREDGGMLHPLHRHPHMRGCCLPESERIQPAAQAHGHTRRQKDQRPRDGDFGPCGTGKRAEPPERQIAQLRVIGEIDQQPAQGPCQRAQGNPRQQHRRDRGAPPPSRHAIQQQRCRPSAQKGRQRDQPKARHGENSHRQQPAQNDCHDRAQSGTRTYPKQTRIRERVAKQPLHHRA